ncbi:ROK family protein [Pradoshia sp.]|uniref:ROK family protein n=1 Tax=Pradoshia sp. TaxID=2651281 RepID=UPI003EFD00BD
MNILGADIGGTSIKIGISDEHGHLTSFGEYPSESKKGGKHLVERLIQYITENPGFEAIGISTAGQVNVTDGSILYANDNIPQYTGTRLKAILEHEFHVPVLVENDANAAAIGEGAFGAGKPYDDFLCLTYGTGIGGAIVLNSQIHRGYNGIAAEFGHMITHPLGYPCNCGRRGCYETYASTTALIRKAAEIDHEFTNGRIIFEAISQGDSRLEKVLDEWVTEVAYGLTSLIHVFNPPAIIIGGGIMEQDMLAAMVDRKVRELIMESYADVQILKARLGNKAGVLGAVSLHSK